MVNFHDPDVIAKDAMAMTKLWHIMGGLYLWEFFTTLEYEWNVIRGRLPYLRTIWIYSLARVATLFCAIIGLVLLNNRELIHCQAEYRFGIASSFLGTAASSLLIVLRVIAVWNRKKVITTVAIGVWVIEIAFLIQATTRLPSWVPAEQGCVPLDVQRNVPNRIAVLVSDIVLLLIMLGGLLRLRGDGFGAFSLAQLMWKQGIIWILIATIAEVLPVVFILLNLNEPFNAMFQQPSYITMTIPATRMYRSLVDFNSRTTDVYDTHPPAPETKRIDGAYIPTIEVAVHLAPEEHRTPRTRNDESGIGTDERMNDKLSGLTRGYDVERGWFSDFPE